MSRLSKEEQDNAVKLLKKSVLLRECTEPQLRELAGRMEKKTYKKGDVLVQEGEPQSKMLVIADGSAVREKMLDGQLHHIDTQLGGYTAGSLHVMHRDPAYATTKCASEVVTTYELNGDDLVKKFGTDADFAMNVARSLQLEVRRYTKAMRTPLLEQHPRRTHYLAVSCAASIESFYRSAMNSLLNQHLTGAKLTTYFPNMHVQLPTRVFYINGFKGLRHYLDEKLQPTEAPFHIQLLAAVAPGVLMTPMSSILEASNAYTNPEPLYTRWTRGLLPRGSREIIFGIGLNQLSDYCEERVPYFENPAIRNAGGSLMAGVLSGYLSHVVHNMSTLKLMNPNKSYGQHFSEYVAKSQKRFPESWSPGLRKFMGYFGAIFFPQGVHIRTSQIVGSFIILNGTIAAMQRYLNPKPRTPEPSS